MLNEEVMYQCRDRFTLDIAMSVPASRPLARSPAARRAPSLAPSSPAISLQIAVKKRGLFLRRQLWRGIIIGGGGGGNGSGGGDRASGLGGVSADIKGGGRRPLVHHFEGSSRR